MRSTWINGIVILLVLMVTGWLRMPYEQALTKEMQEKRLLPPHFDLQTRAALKQKSFAATFGSFRPTLAAVMAVATTNYHSAQQWEEIERAYEEIVLLDPHNEHYWNMGAWHMAYNAAAYYQQDDSLSLLERGQRFREYIQKGSEFLDRGIATNPDGWLLRAEKARLWASPHRIRDFPLVNRTFKELLQKAQITQQQRDSFRRELLYSLLRTPGCEQEAYELAIKLFAEGEHQHFPSLLNALTALQLDPKVKVGNRLELTQIYGDKISAYKHLRNYLKAADGYAPLYGIRSVLIELEEELGIQETMRMEHDRSKSAPIDHE